MKRGEPIIWEDNYPSVADVGLSPYEQRAMR
jgi:hypothetical protein